MCLYDICVPSLFYCCYCNVASPFINLRCLCALQSNLEEMIKTTKENLLKPTGEQVVVYAGNIWGDRWRMV